MKHRKDILDAGNAVYATIFEPNENRRGHGCINFEKLRGARTGTFSVDELVEAAPVVFDVTDANWSLLMRGAELSPFEMRDLLSQHCPQLSL